MLSRSVAATIADARTPRRAKANGGPYLDASFCKIPAMVAISLRAYFGRPPLIELPELNDEFVKDAAGEAGGAA